ncbi:MAG: hypothetical protein JSS10_06510 [Verrucomicrobia bacterium]|nr:hypothetical protein [Verrucomicrobiota bacterium]
MSVYSFNEVFSSAYATVLSLQIERALEVGQSNPSRKRFMQIYDAETKAFLISSFGQVPPMDLHAFLAKIKLPTELVQKYLGQKNFADSLEFYGKEMTMREIQQLAVSEEEDLADTFPSLEEVFQESHAQAEREDQIAEAAKEFAEDRWPFNRMTEEPAAGNAAGPYSYLASFGPTYVASLLSLELTQALETDLEQMAEKTPSLERMGKVCCQTAEKFIQANFQQPVDMQELLLEVEFPTQLVQKYLHVTFPGNPYSVSLTQIQQLIEPSTESSFDALTQELDAILPSLESHLEEASRRAEAEEAAKMEAARIAAEEEAKKTAAASQGLLASFPSLPELPSLSSFFVSTPTATVST